MGWVGGFISMWLYVGVWMRAVGTSVGGSSGSRKISGLRTHASKTRRQDHLVA